MNTLNYLKNTGLAKKMPYKKKQKRMKKIGEDMWKKIEVLLAEKKMTKYELAKKAGLNQNSLIDLKKGRKKSLKFDDVVKIADVLEVSLDEFRNDNT